MNNIIRGNSLEINNLLKQKYRVIITSPPYFKQRQYGDNSDEIGNEKTVEEYLIKLATVFEQCYDYLEDNGSLWIVIGDVRKNNCKLNIPHKLVSILETKGYHFREDIIWHKPNNISGSSKINFTQSYEYILFFSKNQTSLTFMDELRTLGNEAISGYNKKPDDKLFQYKAVHPDKIKIEKLKKFIHNCTSETPISALPSTAEIAKAYGYDPEKHCPTCYRKMKRHATRRRFGGHSHYPILAVCNPNGKNPGNMWSIATKSHHGNEHFAIFPEKLVENIIKFSSMSGDWILDPFMGRGTTGIVSRLLARNFTGIDLYAKNIEVSLKNVTR